MAETGFNFSKFIADSKKTLLSPKEYFTGMEKSGGMVDPIIKAVLYGLAAGIISFILGLLRLGGMGAGMGMFGSAVGIGALIFTPIMAVIGLFIGGVIMLILSAISGGSTDFEANVRVAAALCVLMPVNALLSIFGRISIYLALVIMMLVSLYGLWMTFLALAHTLSAKESVAKIVMIVLAVLAIILSISSFAAMRTVSYMGNRVIEKMEGSTKEAVEARKQAEALLEQIKKQMEEAQKGKTE